MPLMRQRSNWGFVCGRISVLEARLSGKEFFLTLAAQERLEDLVPHLQDTFLREYLAPGSPWEDFNALTDRCFYEYVSSLREESPSPLPADLFLLQGDYLNLRNALSGSREHPFPAGLVPIETVNAIAQGDVSELPVFLKDEAMPMPVTETAQTDPGALDPLLDGAYLRHRLAIAAELGVPMITAYVRESVLARAVAALLRAVHQKRPQKLWQQYFLPIGDFTSVLAEMADAPGRQTWPALLGGPLGDLLAQALEAPEDEQASRFEWLAGNYVTDLAKEGRTQTAGPERVFSFIVGLAAEMRNLKLVVCGLLSRVEGSVLRQRLGECYG